MFYTGSRFCLINAASLVAHIDFTMHRSSLIALFNLTSPWACLLQLETGIIFKIS